MRAPDAPAPAEPASRRLDHLERLQGLTEALSAAATLGDVMRVVIDRALALVEAHAIAVFREIRPGELELAQGVGLTEEYASGFRRIFADEPVPCAEAHRTGQPVWLGSQAEIAARFPTLVPFARREGTEAWAAIPIAAGTARAVVGLQFAAPRELDEDARAFLLAAVHQCAHAVERAHVFDAHKRLADRLQHLQFTAATLSAAATPGDVAAVAFRALGTVGACAAEIHALSEPERLVLVARHGRPAAAPGALVSLEAPEPAAEVVRSGKALWLDSAEIAARYPQLDADRAAREEGSWAVVPLLASGRALGALTVAFRSARPLDAEERTFVRLVAQPCAAALERARSFDEAERSRAEAERTAAVLGAAWNAAPIALALLDREGRFVRVSEAFARTAGLAPPGPLGRTPADAFPGVAGEQLAALVGEVLATGAAVARGVVGETRAEPGSTRRLATSAFPVRVDEVIVGAGLLVSEARDGG